jgi:hypothetical protein
MHGDRSGERLAIETAHIAAVVMKAHEAVHRRNGVERRIDSGVHLLRRSPAHRNLHERAEQRPGASHDEVKGHVAVQYDATVQYDAASLIGGGGSHSLKFIPARANAPRVSKVLPS